MDRRGFLTSFGKKIAKERGLFSYLYLPYITEFSLIQEICKGCEKHCAKVCETDVIVIKDDMPTLDMSKNGCTFCKKCAIVCTDNSMNVLDSNLEGNINIAINIKTLTCLSWNQTMCFICKDVCKFKAISFFGAFRPTIDESLCRGCGMCINICPSNAIEISKIFSDLKERK